MKRLLIWCLGALMCASSYAETITVASKNFGESYLLAEMVSQLLEASGHTVDRRFGLGGTLVCHQALISGEVDLYIEYTGTLEQVILKGNERHPTVASLNQRVHPELLVLDSLGFNNTYAIALKQSLAEQLGISTIGDLAEQQLNLAFSLEFLNREDGWPGLSAIYNIQQTPIGIDHGLAYQAIEQGKVDVTDAYSTDGDLARYQLTALVDDKSYFPDYFAVPLLRKDLPADVIETVSTMTNRLSDERMRSLNARVVVDGETFAQVAAVFLRKEGLIAQDSVVVDHTNSILKNTLTHLKLTGIALLLGCLIGLPLGVIVFRHRNVAQVVVYVAGLMQTVPSIALLALMIPLFGIGEVPAIIALFLYSILPILRNTITALVTIDPVLKRVAEALGLTRSQQLRLILVPMATPNILGGIRTAAVISIGTATLAAFIGAGGLGEPIVTGLALNDTDLILQGAIPAAMLAIVVELSFELLERFIVKPHMLQGQLPV